MDQQAMSGFVDRVLADADRAFGSVADEALLDRYARETVIELWASARSAITVSGAESVLRELRAVRARMLGGERRMTTFSRNREICG